MTNNNQHEFESKLDDALAMVAAGIPLEVVLTEVGADAEWLEPLLAVADEAGQLQAAIPLPPPDASLNRMLAHAEKMAAAHTPAPTAKPGGRFGWLQLGPLLATGFRTAVLAASVLVAFLAGTVTGSGMTMAAQNSLPGQPFYGLKRAGETFRFNLIDNTEHRQRLEDTLNLERQFETDLLLDSGKQTTVTFEDTVQSVQGRTFTVDGWEVQMSDNTALDGELAAGARVRLKAITQPPNILRALTVTVVRPAPATPSREPAPPPPATATPTATPWPSPTPAQAGDTLTVSTPTKTASPPANDFVDETTVDSSDNSAGGVDDANQDVVDDNFNDNGDSFDDGNSGPGGSDNSNDTAGDENLDNSNDDNLNDNSGDDNSFEDDDFNANEDDFSDENSADNSSDGQSDEGSSDNSGSGSDSSGSDNSGSDDHVEEDSSGNDNHSSEDPGDSSGSDDSSESDSSE